MSAVALQQSDNPVVSLVMVTYGGFERALATLRSLADTADVPCEVIVVDNASPDGAGSRLADAVVGPAFILGDRNVGYGAGANLGVLHSRGDYVGILNSDLEFETGWLRALVDALEGDPRAGAAVPLYLQPSGDVFDAGGLLGDNGLGYAYGEGFRVGDAEVSFQRYIDYGSAAAILVRRRAFDQVGGFDPIYGLGYFEDTDLGFALRRAGYQTVYVPAAKVRHAQGGSFNRKLRTELMARNRSVFASRYADELRGRPRLVRPPRNLRRDLVVRDWWTTDRVLVLGGPGAEVASRAAVASPYARVTLVSQGEHTAIADSWIEHVPLAPGDLPRWLESRRFHYSAVVDATGSGDAGRHVARSQPQATVVPLGSDLALTVARALSAG